jgi:hypothetical protein
MSAVRFESVAFRACLFFARNPDEWLTSGDIASKWGITSKAVRPTLHYAVSKGYLAKHLRQDSERLHIYTAGPTLRAMVGA